MRTASKILKTGIWIILAVYLVMQVAAVAGILIQNAQVAAGGEGTSYNVLPLIGATALMTAAVLLFMFLRRYRQIGLIIGAAAAVLMLVVALDMGRVFAPPSVGSAVGLTLPKLLLHHVGMDVIPLLMLPAWLLERQARKQEKGAWARVAEDNFHLDGEPVFKDEPELHRPGRLRRPGGRGG